jgi:hypothetical protein
MTYERSRGDRYALSALRNRRATIAAEIVSLERQLRHCKESLVHVDATLRLLDDSIDLDATQAASQEGQAVRAGRVGPDDPGHAQGGRWTAAGNEVTLSLEAAEAMAMVLHELVTNGVIDYLDEVVGPASALIPSHGTQRRKTLKLLGCATAACDKAVAINYERRRPANLIYDDWIKRCRSQLVAALVELESTRLQLVHNQPLRQITTGTLSASSQKPLMSRATLLLNA